MVGARVEAEGEEGRERRGGGLGRKVWAFLFEPDLGDCEDGTLSGSHITASSPSVGGRLSADTAILRHLTLGKLRDLVESAVPDWEG
jgi:hypothetical protein